MNRINAPALALLLAAGLCAWPSSAAARPRRKAKPKAATLDLASMAYPGAKPNKKAAQAFIEANDAKEVLAYSVAKPFASVAGFYKARLSSKAQFESESSSMYLVGYGALEVRVERRTSRSSLIYLIRKSDAPAQRGPQGGDNQGGDNGPNQGYGPGQGPGQGGGAPGAPVYVPPSEAAPSSSPPGPNVQGPGSTPPAPPQRY